MVIPVANQGPVPIIPERLKTPMEKISSLGNSTETTIKPVNTETAPTIPELVETQQSLMSAPSGKSQNDSKVTPAPPKTTSILKEKVVDRSKGRPVLHSLQNSPDKLTTLADNEEEEFIEKVETVHEPNI